MTTPYRCRVLIRVVWARKGKVKVCIPAWNARSFFTVPRHLFPLLWRIRRDFRFFGYANLGAANVEGLKITGVFTNPDPRF